MSEEIERIAKEIARELSGNINRIVRQGHTEADFRRDMAQLLDEAVSRACLTIIPRDEFSVARGRVDSVYNRLILEYKRPGILKGSNTIRSNQDVIQQVKNYILDVAKREKREANRLAGVATDGHFFIFVRRVGEGWSVDDPAPVNKDSTEHFLRLLFALSIGAALVPENLVEDFGPRTLRAQRAVRSIYATLHASRHPLVQKLFDQWRLFFSEATDYKEWAERIEGKEEFQRFVKGMGLDPKYAEAPKVFFALHTYYALLIKLVASLAAARFAGGQAARLSAMAIEDSVQLKCSLVDLEGGGIFKEYGIRNFLEGDFFGWYLAAWNPEIEEAVRHLIKRLAEYDPGTLELAPENARDLLKKLYHYLLPREIRHDLGEYYTPDWLAERLIRQTLGQDLGDPAKRILDPGCGSGTFLVLVINHIKREAQRRKMGPTETLDAIRKNVIGFDLNPLAVIAARTNYILALGELLKEAKHLGPDGIDIPVYQCDSVLTPIRGEGLFDNGLYKLKTSVGIFEIPEAFATKERMYVLANLLDESVESGVGEESFLERLSQSVDIYQRELEAAREPLRELYRHLVDLHGQGLNGVWARIIKNGFAPLFQEPVHYIVGNPPWVNWEHLPDEYRQRSIPIWQRYGLFPHGGMDTILGKGKKDISMLMTYVSMDKYLLPNGKLGFVLSQSLFKTSGAGQGFRRFVLPSGTPIGPLSVEDMVELKPFEGATNRTSVAILGKGYPVRYPVPYSYWIKKKEGRGSAVDFDTPYEEVTSELITFRKWHAEPVNEKDKTSAWITARPKALKALRKLLGPSEYVAHTGCYTGGANAVFWFEILGIRPGNVAIVQNITEGAKRKVDSTKVAVEIELLYPLLRGRDLKRWQTIPSCTILMTQDPKTRQGIDIRVMQSRYPKAFTYLNKQKSILMKRKDRGVQGLLDKGAPFYSIFAVADYTFSSYKVVWKRVADEMDAAVVSQTKLIESKRPVVPDATCMMVSFISKSAAHFVCALMNSSPVRLAIRNYIVLHPDTHVLRNISIPKFLEKNRVHLKIAELSEVAHKAASADTDEVKRSEQEIDRWASKLWGLSEEELAEIQRSLEE